MEKFDIDKEMAKFKGLNIIEKCSALDDLLDDLEDAQEQIICAKDDISEEYANVFKKKFHEEIASFIAETFDGKIPCVEKYGYKIMYDNMPIYIFLYLWWMVYLSFCKEWKYKTSDKTCRCFRCQYNREWGIFELRSYRERFAFQGEANPVTLRLLWKMNLSSGKILISYIEHIT